MALTVSQVRLMPYRIVKYTPLIYIIFHQKVHYVYLAINCTCKFGSATKVRFRLSSHLHIMLFCFLACSETYVSMGIFSSYSSNYLLDGCVGSPDLRYENPSLQKLSKTSSKFLVLEMYGYMDGSSQHTSLERR